MRKNEHDLDNALYSLDEWEAKERGETVVGSSSQKKIMIGSVEEVFSRINVAAIKLSGSLSVGDIIEIGTEDDAVRQKVSSMQINKTDVLEAFEGDSIGIKLSHPVEEGSAVYKISK